MSDITVDCADALGMEQAPCKSEDYGFPVKIVLGHPDGTLTVAGDAPTYAEIAAGVADTGVNKLVVLEEITNANRVEGEIESESGADTADGLSSTFGVNINTVGRVKLLDETVRADLATLAIYHRLRVWTITSGGWIFGGANGYKVSNFISPIYMEGFGARAYHAFSFTHRHNRNNTDPALQDDQFLDLANPAGT